MFVITASVGNSFRNDRSLSSASATISSPRPRRALLPKALSRPPITAVGSSPACSSIRAIIDVVVVFPWAPATATAYRSRISSASISARGITGICRRTASTTSTFVGRTADDTTTTSAPPTWLAVCPYSTCTPSVVSRSVTAERFSSEPETICPRLTSSSAIPLMPIPPTPMKCTRRVFPNTAVRCPHLAAAACSTGCQLQRPIDDQSRGVRPCKRPCGAGHLRAPWHIGDERAQARGQRLSGGVRLQQHLRGAGRCQRLGVLALVIVGRGRQRNENRRLPGRRELRQRRRPGAADDQVRCGDPPSHVVQERFDLGLNPGRLVGGSDHLHVSLSRLVCDTKRRTAGRQLRCCLHHGHVDRVRALRAAKD